MQEAVPILVGCRRKFKFTILQRFNQKWIVDEDSGCHMWTASTKAALKYGAFGIDRSTDCGRFKIVANAHRVSWEIHNGPIPAGLCVLHRCDTPRCVNPDHLFLGTLGDNNRDCAAKGRKNSPMGENAPRVTLTNRKVRAIRSSTDSTRKAARIFGVTSSQISRIRCRKQWRHVP